MNTYLSPDQVARLIPGMSKGALAQLRYTGKGPRFLKPTPKTVVYVESEVIEWLENSGRDKTSSLRSAIPHSNPPSGGRDSSDRSVGR
ncbi:MAG: hypothetical protein JWM55_597 [Acidimicrobiaceae bacterium]|nr:hypothetical protein [Acidimicrobiaceae bacterium]